MAGDDRPSSQATRSSLAASGAVQGTSSTPSQPKSDVGQIILSKFEETKASLAVILRSQERIEARITAIDKKLAAMSAQPPAYDSGRLYPQLSAPVTTQLPRMGPAGMPPL